MKSLREAERKVTNKLKSKEEEDNNIEEIHLDIDKNDTKVKAIIKASSGHALRSATKEHQTHLERWINYFKRGLE